MTGISKSRFMNLYTCPKLAWLHQHLPDEAAENSVEQATTETGKKVGLLARGLFHNPVDVTVEMYGRLNLIEMIERTKEEIAKGTEVICEASFSVDNLFCSVDILKGNSDGWDIYEVKSSTANSLEDNIGQYSMDIAFQKYVLEKCGLKVENTYLICINSDYIRGPELELDKLFAVIEMNNDVAIRMADVEHVLASAEVIDSATEPAIPLSTACYQTGKKSCPYWDYCTKDLPKPNVFDLYRIKAKDAFAYCEEGLVGFEDLAASGCITNEKQLRQIDYQLNEKGVYIDAGGIKKFLSEIRYPIYFLDFESVQPAIPEFEGTKPYMQLVTQYSVHIIEQEGGPLLHKEYLAESGKEPRRGVAEALCKDIPGDGCVIVYNKNFEATRLKEMAEAFPDLAEGLLAIRDNIVDLLLPFQKGWYYKREMGGSFSIKVVLPALFPDDPELDYHKLEGVHNGTEAMNLWPKLQYMEPSERARLERNLLRYCELDTYAMVKIWEFLKLI